MTQSAVHFGDDYLVLQTLSQDDEGSLSRVRRRDDVDACTFLSRTANAMRAGPALIERARNELNLSDFLESSWAAKPIELVSVDERTRLLMSDPAGDPLSGIIGSPLPVPQFLDLAIAISHAVSGMHTAGLLHKDIKPAHILVSHDRHSAWLTGFGIASRMPRERQSPTPPEVMAGTLAYMAPEQTGRMNRSIDSRSDLYAVGATFYEMLTGVLPFTASDPMEWIHCHIARLPVSPFQRLQGAIPEIVSNIVMKLLSKEAEDRYQTAASLLSDLKHCKIAWDTRNDIAPFALGTNDATGRLTFREKLYGREQAVARLVAAFSRMVLKGTTELVLVSGYSGIGKSTLVNEVHKPLVPPRGLFAAGKFDQYKRGIPYDTLAQAFKGLVRHLLSKSEAELAGWRTALSQALGNNGQLMIHLIPDLEHVLGPQPAVPDLSGPEAQSRFRLVFRQFVGVFARPEHPLVLFLDDLQWLDAATLDVFESLALQTEPCSLMLVGAYRDNETGPGHPLVARLDKIRRSGTPVEDIVLQDIQADDVNLLIADALGETPQRSAPLGQLVYEKAGGNPFFTTQFVSMLVDEQLLHYDSNARYWQWDLKGVAAKHVSDNVVDLMVERLCRLPESSQQALRQLGCMGNTVKRSVFQRVVDASQEDVQTRLYEAFRTGLVFQSEDTYAFAHDRVHEAAYAIVPEAERGPAHWRIGLRMLAALDETEIDTQVFDIASQFNRGTLTGVDPAERSAAARTNLRAGRKAKASAAYTAASGYLAQGRKQLGEDAWQSHYALAFALGMEQAECSFLAGNFQEVEEMINHLLERGSNEIDLAAVYRLKIEMHVVKSDNARAVDSAIAALRLFGIDVEAHPTHSLVEKEYQRTWTVLGDRPFSTFSDLPPMTDERMLAVMRILAELWAPAFYTDFNLTIIATCKMVYLSLEHGIARASYQGCAWFGWLLGCAFDRYHEGLAVTKLLLERATEAKAQIDVARIYVVIGLTATWTEPLLNSVDYLRRAYKIGSEAGDLYFGSYALFHSAQALFISSENLEAVHEDCERAIAISRAIDFRDSVDCVYTTERAVASLRGRTRGFPGYDDDAFDQSAFEAELTGTRQAVLVYWYWTRRMMLLVMAGDPDGALAAAEKVQISPWVRILHMQNMDFHYFRALALAMKLDADAVADRKTVLAEIAAHHAQLRSWADLTRSPTFADKPVLLEAELARLDGRSQGADQLYRESIRIARDNGFLQYEAVCHETAARFHQRKGAEEVARTHVREARSCYARWGALAKVRQLEELHQFLREEHSAASTTVAQVEQLDLATVIKVAQTISGEMVLENAIEKLMRVAMEHAGAERAVLMLADGGSLEVDAEAVTSGCEVIVRLRGQLQEDVAFPTAVAQYVARTKEPLILDDASTQPPFDVDDHIRDHRVRSVLALPLIDQGKQVGLLYLENNLAANVFTPIRISILKLIVSYAATALENARLYRALEERESRISRLIDANIIGVFMWTLDGKILDANDSFLEMLGYSREELIAGRMRWPELTTAESLARDMLVVEKIRATGIARPFEKEFFHKNGARVPVLMGAAAFRKSNNREEGISYVLDLSSSRKAEEDARASDRRYRELQSELAHANRVAIIGQLSAAISHDVKQPLVSIVTSGSAGLNWLAANPPNVAAARQSFERIVAEGHRAADVLDRTRALVKKQPPKTEPIDINAVIIETGTLIRAEAQLKRVALQIELADKLPSLTADRIQLQQVILNLMVNAMEAMAEQGNEPRVLTVSTGREADDQIFLTLSDTGPGVPEALRSAIFTAFYTTKAHGMGLGLSICKTIVEAHGGKLWVRDNAPSGSVFVVTLPVGG